MITFAIIAIVAIVLGRELIGEIVDGTIITILFKK